MEEIVKPETEKIIEDKNKEPDILQIAKKRTEDLEKANKDLEEQIKKNDRLIAESIVRGRSFAGQKEKTEEEKISEEAEKYANAMGRSFKAH